jgi:CheY-like chemotaxis protein
MRTGIVMPIHAKMIWNPSDNAIWRRAAIKSSIGKHFVFAFSEHFSGEISCKETTGLLHYLKLLWFHFYSGLREQHGLMSKVKKIKVCQRMIEGRRLPSIMNIPHDKFVLCVDDDPDDRLIICEAIKEADSSLTVVEAKNGVEAHQLLKEAKIIGRFPCLIILDINMPLMNGKETLKEIKKDEMLKSLPVVFFTTSSNPRDQFFSSEYGVEFITKPPHYDLIVATIKDILSRCNG